MENPNRSSMFVMDERTYPFAKAARALLLDKRIGAHHKILYLYLRDRCGGKAYTWVSLTTIARDLGYSSTGSIHKYLNELKDLGLVAIESRPDKNTGRKNYYRLMHYQLVYGDELYKSWDELYYEEEEITHGDLSPREDPVLPDRIPCSPPERTQVETYNNKHTSNLSNEDVAHLNGSSDSQSAKTGFNRLDLLKGGFGSKSSEEDPADYRKRLASEAKAKRKAEEAEAKLRRKEEAARASEVCPEGVSKDVWEEQRAGSLLHKFYGEKMAEYGFGSVPRATGKDYGQIKTFYKKLETIDRAKKFMDYVLKNWSELKKQYTNLGNHPGIGIFASRWVDEMMPQAFNDEVKSSETEARLKDREWGM